MTVSLTWVDAFVDTLGAGVASSGRPFSGNPAAVCLPHAELSDAFMQSLAFELGIAETAFVVPADEPDTFGLRWFSPTTEIDLCGHATLASAHALRQHGVVDGISTLTFHTRSGPLRASFGDERIELDFPATAGTPIDCPAALAGQWDDADVVAVSRGDFFVMVVLGRAALVRDYAPDVTAIAASGDKALLLTAPADEASTADYVLRVFGPNVGIDEDPATGSAQCMAGPYWAERLGRTALVAHQVSPRGAVLHVRPEGDRVFIAGVAHSVLSGHLC
jgi:PhzF family phenazine biosynthesis protein